MSKILLICNYRPGVGGISGQVEILQRKLREEGHSADIFNTKASTLKRLFLIGKLKRVARGYDVLHIHCCSDWGFLPAVVGITAGRRLGKRIVLTYHGGGGEQFFERHTRLVRHYLTHTDQNIVLSGFLAKVFDRFHLPYTIIPNIIELDPKHFRFREELKPNFICTRAHEELYNIPLILRAFKKVQAERPEATLTLVGDGSQHQQLIEMTKELGLNNVTFTGKVDNSEIYKYLDKADIFVSTPKVDNMPVSLLEAMNAGLPVISSRVGGVPYIIEQFETGMLFDIDDFDGLVAWMTYPIVYPDDGEEFILQARKAVDAYRWENIKDKIYAAYGIRS